MTKDECCFVCWHIADIQALQLYLPCANGAGTGEMMKPPSSFRWADLKAQLEMERVWMVCKRTESRRTTWIHSKCHRTLHGFAIFLLGTFPDPMSGGTHWFQKSVWSFGLYSKRPSWGQNLETRHQHGLGFGFEWCPWITSIWLTLLAIPSPFFALKSLMNQQPFAHSASTLHPIM